MARMLGICALVVVGALGVGCSSDEGLQATVAPETATVEVSATPRALVTAMPTVEVVEATPEPPDVGVLVMDVATGETTELYRGSEYLLLGDRFYPRSTGDQSAVWLSVESWGEARRFGLDGQLLFTVDGWGAIESDDGLSHSYYLVDEDGTLLRSIAVERRGVRRIFDGRVVRRAFSPDGRSIAIELSGVESQIELVVLDIETGDSRVLATDVGLCQCDGGPTPRWSPSGDYLAYSDFDYDSAADEPMGSGSFVAHAASGEIVQLVPRNGWAGRGWGNGDTIDYRDGLELWRFDARTGTRKLLAVAPEGGSVDLLGGGYLAVEELIDARSRQLETVLVDQASGAEIERWPGSVNLTVVTDGVAVIARDSSSLPYDCSGVWVDHPLLDAPLCFHDANWWASWSPDGSKLAVLRHVDGDSSVIEVVDLRSGERILSEPIEARIAFMSWNDAGTHIVGAWGVGV